MIYHLLKALVVDLSEEGVVGDDLVHGVGDDGRIQQVEVHQVGAGGPALCAPVHGDPHHGAPPPPGEGGQATLGGEGVLEVEGGEARAVASKAGGEG